VVRNYEANSRGLHFHRTLGAVYLTDSAGRTSELPSSSSVIRETVEFRIKCQVQGKLNLTSDNLQSLIHSKPTTDLERSVDNLLKASKLREEDIYETEETMLKMNKLSVEEIAQRRTSCAKCVSSCLELR
jgi:hypothetical protein